LTLIKCHSIKRSIPFEQFNLSCQDLLLLFPKNILDMEKLGLLERWQYGVVFDGSRIITTHASTKIARPNIKVRQEMHCTHLA
jgi:hypothetical protein